MTVAKDDVVAALGKIASPDGVPLPATVVRFDVHNDIAILRVPGLDRRALPLVRSPRRQTLENGSMTGCASSPIWMTVCRGSFGRARTIAR